MPLYFIPSSTGSYADQQTPTFPQSLSAKCSLRSCILLAPPCVPNSDILSPTSKAELHENLRLWEATKNQCLCYGFYCCDKQHDPQEPRSERICFALRSNSSLREVRTGNKGKNLQIRTEAEATEECCSLTLGSKALSSNAAEDASSGAH